MVPDLIAAVAVLELYSPLTIRIPYATYHSGSYPMPPPSTIKGAIAFSYAWSNNIPEQLYRSKIMEKINNNIAYVSAAYTDIIIKSMQLERFYQGIYQRQDRVDDPRYRWGVYFNEAYGIFSELLIFALFRDESLAKYIHGITRVGRKETLASVVDVVIDKPEISYSADECNKFYYPEYIASADAPHISFEDRRDRWMRYLLPLATGKRIKYSPTHRGAIARVGDFCAPIPRSAIE